MNRIVVTTIILLSTASVATAQELSGSLTSFGGGPAFTSGDSVSIGLNLFFSYGGLIDENIGIRGELTFYRFSASNETNQKIGTSQIATEYSGYTFGGGLRLDFLGGQFRLGKSFLAYGIVGFGVNVAGTRGDFRSSVTIGSQTTSKSGMANSDAEVDASFRIGAGAGFRTSRRFAVVLELLYETTGDFHYVPVRIGFSFLP